MSTTARAQFEITISGYDLARGVERALAGTKLHLHNLGTLKGATYHADDAASIKWPLSAGPGLRTRFTLPEVRLDVLGRRYSYYIDHVRSTGLSVTAEAETLKLTIQLAPDDTAAFVGRCLRLRAPVVPCRVLGDENVPSVEWLSAHIDIFLRPVAFERSLAFDVTGVTLGGTFDVGNVCEWRIIGRRLCARLNAYSATVNRRVASEVRASLDTPQVKREIARSVRKVLDETYKIPVLGVRRVSMKSGQILLALGFGR